MNTLGVLKAARELLSDPKRWTKGAFARDAKGNSIGDQRGDAECFCSAGAVFRCERGTYSRAMSELIAEIPGAGVTLFNDRPETTHADVLALFDRTIARLESR